MRYGKNHTGGAQAHEARSRRAERLPAFPGTNPDGEGSLVHHTHHRGLASLLLKMQPYALGRIAGYHLIRKTDRHIRAVTELAARAQQAGRQVGRRHQDVMISKKRWGYEFSLAGSPGPENMNLYLQVPPPTCSRNHSTFGTIFIRLASHAVLTLRILPWNCLRRLSRGAVIWVQRRGRKGDQTGSDTDHNTAKKVLNPWQNAPWKGWVRKRMEMRAKSRFVKKN